VRTVVVDALGETSRGAQIREALAAVLAGHGLSSPADGRIPDARLQGSLRETGGGTGLRLSLSLVLVNLDGETLWSTPPGGMEAAAGHADDVRRLAERALSSLVKALEGRREP
jgi:hypothetical protein